MSSPGEKRVAQFPGAAGAPEAALMEAILSQFPREFQPLAPPEGIGDDRRGFSGAVIVRLETSRGPFCLRGWPQESLPEARICGLHRLLAHTRRCGIEQVAAPEASLSGETVVEAAGRFWQLEPWMPGTADFREQPTEARLRDALRTLARWHQAAGGFQPQEEERRWFSSSPQGIPPAAVERLERIAVIEDSLQCERLAALLANERSEFGELGREILSLYSRAAAAVAAYLRVAAERAVPLQPCWRDLWHDHLLFTGEQLTGLIDASACRTENVASDLSRLLGSLVEDDPARWEFALAAYQEIRPLSVDELALVTALDHSQTLLAGMVWLERWSKGGIAERELPRIVERLHQTVRRLRKLAAGPPRFPLS